MRPRARRTPRPTTSTSAASPSRAIPSRTRRRSPCSSAPSDSIPTTPPPGPRSSLRYYYAVSFGDASPDRHRARSLRRPEGPRARPEPHRGDRPSRRARDRRRKARGGLREGGRPGPSPAAGWPRALQPRLRAPLRRAHGRGDPGVRDGPRARSAKPPLPVVRVPLHAERRLRARPGLRPPRRGVGLVEERRGRHPLARGQARRRAVGGPHGLEPARRRVRRPARRARSGARRPGRRRGGEGHGRPRSGEQVLRRGPPGARRLPGRGPAAAPEGRRGQLSRPRGDGSGPAVRIGSATTPSSPRSAKSRSAARRSSWAGARRPRSRYS